MFAKMLCSKKLALLMLLQLPGIRTQDPIGESRSLVPFALQRYSSIAKYESRTEKQAFLEHDKLLRAFKYHSHLLTPVCAVRKID
jgi:hypothetical protein